MHAHVYVWPVQIAIVVELQYNMTIQNMDRGHNIHSYLG